MRWLYNLSVRVAMQSIKCALCRWQDEISEIVHDLITSRLTFKDDASCYENDLRRKRDQARHAKIEAVLSDMRVWLASEDISRVSHGCLHVTSDEVGRNPLTNFMYLGPPRLGPVVKIGESIMG